jgi:hypothetical protein
MSKQILTDSNNRTIGYIDTQSDGKQLGFNANNKLMGYYDAKANRTTDANNKFVGQGNLLSSLLRS